MGKSKIEWTHSTWSPVTGCTKVSGGCRNCYAERMARRLAGRFGYPEAPHHFDVTLHPDRLDEPLRWKKPRTVFVVSMGDLFHEDVPEQYIAKVFGVMTAMHEHTFQVLTKRPGRMLELMSLPDSSDFRIGIAIARNRASGKARNYSPVFSLHSSIPLPNIWLGVSVENQATADERIPPLLQTPAAVRFVSYEPALGPVDLTYQLRRINYVPLRDSGDPYVEKLGLDWVICGGESGPGARPMDWDWVRDIRDQCQSAGVAFFLKQGIIDGRMVKLPELDGKQWKEFPNAIQRPREAQAETTRILA